MNWKEENPRERYIDSITEEEAYQIAFLAAGEPNIFKITGLKKECNGNNIPHVEIHYEYLEPTLMEYVETHTGIFANLDVYVGGTFHMPSCQAKIFEMFGQMGFYPMLDGTKNFTNF
jgi:hypothetical protein